MSLIFFTKLLGQVLKAATACKGRNRGLEFKGAWAVHVVFWGLANVVHGKPYTVATTKFDISKQNENTLRIHTNIVGAL